MIANGFALNGWPCSRVQTRLDFEKVNVFGTFMFHVKQFASDLQFVLDCAR